MEGEDDARPITLLGGGEHFKDCDVGRRLEMRIPRKATSTSIDYVIPQNTQNIEVTPRSTMVNHVKHMMMHRPPPIITSH